MSELFHTEEGGLPSPVTNKKKGYRNSTESRFSLEGYWGRKKKRNVSASKKKKGLSFCCEKKKGRNKSHLLGGGFGGLFCGVYGRRSLLSPSSGLP